MTGLGWILLALLQIIILVMLAYALPQVTGWSHQWKTRRRHWLAQIIQVRHAMRDSRRKLGVMAHEAEIWQFRPKSPKLKILWFLWRQALARTARHA